METELVDLRISCSEQQARDLAAQAAADRTHLLDAPEAIQPELDRMATAARELGWEATMQAYDPNLEPAETRGPLVFATARGKLVPADDNPNPFGSLLNVLGLFSQGDKQIDLTRLGVRADERGRLSVDLNLRFACAVSDAKAAE